MEELTKEEKEGEKNFAKGKLIPSYEEYFEKKLTESEKQVIMEKHLEAVKEIY